MPLSQLTIISHCLFVFICLQVTVIASLSGFLWWYHFLCLHCSSSFLYFFFFFAVFPSRHFVGFFISGFATRYCLAPCWLSFRLRHFSLSLIIYISTPMPDLLLLFFDVMLCFAFRFVYWLFCCHSFLRLLIFAYAITPPPLFTRLYFLRFITLSSLVSLIFSVFHIAFRFSTILRV